MTEPTMFTAQQAADPGTPPQMLADIAALRADLRPFVAGNPSAYPGLLEWLGSLGEPAVDAALAARAGAEQGAPPAATGWAPAAPSTVPHQTSNPWQGQSAQTWQGQPGQPAQPWQGQPGQPGQPAQPWQGQPGQPGQPAQPWQGQQGQPGQPAQPWHGQPGQPYGYQPVGAAPSKGGKTALIVVGVVLAVLLVIGVGGFFAVRALFANAVDSFGSMAPTMLSSGQNYGDDQALDLLWDSCSAGDWVSCDDLYYQSGAGTEYESFATSCGGTETDAGGTCASIHGMAPTAPADGANAYGDDPALDALYDSCKGGDMVACDSLYDQSPIGSEYETFGDSCGGTRDAGLGIYCTEN